MKIVVDFPQSAYKRMAEKAIGDVTVSINHHVNRQCHLPAIVTNTTIAQTSLNLPTILQLRNSHDVVTC